MARAPTAGAVTYGPNDTFHTLTGAPTPTVSTDTTANSLTLQYGTYHDPNQAASLVDLLFTVTASKQPFADGLFLTNQAHEQEGSTDNGGSTANAIVQIQLTEPGLVVSKGVVSTNDAGAVLAPLSGGPAGVTFKAPGSGGVGFTGTISSGNPQAGSGGLAAGPVASALTNAQAGDLVRFAVVAQNLGTGLHGAFNVTLADVLPAGFVIPAGGLKLEVTDGAGNALAYSAVNGADTNPFFQSGIHLTDPSASQGALSAYDPISGHNLVVITYDLQVAGSDEPLQKIPNTATLADYTSTPDNSPANNFVPGGVTAATSVTLEPPVAVKSLVATTDASNATFVANKTTAAVGEKVQYSVTLTIPQGTTSAAQLVDTLSPGLAFVQLDSVAASAGVSYTGTPTAPTLTNNGQTATFNFGTITNTDTDPTAAETITLVYEAVVLDTAGNTSNTQVTRLGAVQVERRHRPVWPPRRPPR